MSAKPNDAQAPCKRFSAPSFWSDLPLRDMAIRTHRQMSIREALATMQAELGRAPSKSALARFWKNLDGSKRDILLLAEARANDEQAIAKAVFRQREAAAKARKAAFWRESWRYAKSGPLPMAIVLVDGWRRLTHKWHPSALLLSALEVARQGAERSIQELCENDPAATRCVRLRLLRWLTGEQETDSEAPECDADLEALLPISNAGEQAEGQASLQRSPNLLTQRHARPPRSLRDLEDQLLDPAHQARGAGSAPKQSPASSAPIGPVSSASPIDAAPACPAPIDAEPATRPTAAHRLSEVSE